jgi:acyl-coenzyme A synthetase/AMP-(fatty) acid ligase/acyl carrier protein
MASRAKHQIVERIRSHAWLMPPRVAIEHGPRSVTYLGLADQVEWRSRALANTVRPGRFVAVEHPRSIELVVDFLAILALDAIPVLIDPALPEQRRRLLRELLAPGGSATADGSYVFFTSGSTGRPRPVLGSASALQAFLEWQGAEFDIGADDRFAFLTALSFDVVVRDIVPPLWAGATLVIPAGDECDSPESTVAWLASADISVVNVVPSVARSWLRHGLNRCESLRTVFFAGEPVPAPLVDEWHAMFPRTQTLVNFYGTTETTLPKVYKRLRRTEDGSGNLPAGRPVPETSVCLIDPAEPLSAELIRAAFASMPNEGEVVLVSQHASHGYVGLPDETRARFVDLGGGFTAYRTGDLGRLDHTGELTVLGRADDEVKINGVRIHPAEVAATIRAGGLVADAFVTAHGHGLTAYVVPARGSGLDPAELRDALGASMPPAMIPGRFVELATLPNLPNGKVDRAALRELDAEPVLSGPFVAPSGEIECWLADRWAELFDTGPVSATADFFAYGGDSIAAMQLSARIRRDLGVALSVRDIFAAATVRALAQAIADRQVLSVDAEELLAMLATVEGVGSHD